MAKAVPFKKSSSNLPVVRTQPQVNLDDVKLKSLLTTPEARKMLELDKELTEIINRSDLNMNEKYKLYEVTLARYKIFQKKVIDKGYRLTNGLRGLSEKISEMLQNAVNQHMQQSISLEDESDQTAASNTENETAFETINDVGTSQIQQPQGSSTPIVHSKISTTPLHVKPLKVRKEEQDDTVDSKSEKTVLSYKSPSAKLKTFLIRHGVKILPSGDLYFSPSTKASTSVAPTRVKGTEYDKTVNYLLTEDNPELIRPDRQIANFIKKIRAIMKKEKNLESVNDLIHTFPILNDLKMQAAIENKKKRSLQKGNGLPKRKIQKFKKWCTLD